MRRIVAGLLLLVGIVHLLPLAGVLGAERIAGLYGVAVEDPNLAILMRHRAVLFGLLGALLVWAALRPALTGIALLAGYVSVGSFLLLAHATGGYNAQLATVVRVDWAALACLVAATAAWWRSRAGART